MFNHPVMYPSRSAKSYLKKVLSVEKANLVGLWLQNEPAGGVAFDYSGHGHDGAYTGVTLGGAGVPGTGYTSPLYDGANDYNDIYSTSLNTAFSGAEGTLLAWAKVSGAGVWEDSTIRGIARLEADANNYVFISRHSDNNTVRFVYKAGGTVEIQDTGSLSNVDYACYAMTWSKSGGFVDYYIDGTASGSPDVQAGTWVGDLDSTKAVIGAVVTTPGSVWSGNIGPVPLWNKALTADQIAYLSKT